MSVLHIALLALVQGITEFLPISSSGHLLLTDQVLAALQLVEPPPPQRQLALSVAVHVGTLGAVMLYFWRDLWTMVDGLGRAVVGPTDAGARLAALVIIGTVPVVIAGLVVHAYGPWGLRSLTVIGWATLGFGIVLYLADRLGMTVRRVEHMTIGDAIFIGCLQALALIPGTSRSGITMSAARMLGMERAEAARFSMLLAMPAIAAAGGLEGWALWRAGDSGLTTDAGLAAGLAFVVAWPAIALLMAWLRRASFTPFVVYRILLGALLLAFAYGFTG